MATIVYVMVSIFDNRFKCNYLRTKKLIINYLIHFLNLNQTLNDLEKDMIFIAYAFPKLLTAKDVAR